MRISRLRNFKSILRPRPQDSETTLDCARIYAWPPAKCNLCANQLTIFFCSLCHCSLTSFLSLSSSFFLVRRGWKQNRNIQKNNIHTGSFKPFVSILHPKVPFTKYAFCLINCLCWITYLHEFVGLEHCCCVKHQLAVFNVIFESSHVGLTERHEFLNRGRRALNVNTEPLKVGSKLIQSEPNQQQHLLTCWLASALADSAILA